jgi:hypothetical protein
MSEISLSPVLTSAGLAAVAAAHGQGLQAKITHIALGDGGYAIRYPSDTPLATAQARTVMQSEQVRVGVYAGAVPGPQQIVVEARIDAGKPNFWVKEVGFFLDDGTLFAIWSSDTLNLGFRGDLVPWVFRFALAWTQLPDNAVTVAFSGDAGYSDLWGRLNDHITSQDPHPSQIEPAFRTDCEPCLLEFAEPGENLPAPFVFSRPGKGIGFNARGQYTMVAANVLRDHYDPDTLEHKGKLYIPNAYKSSCQNYNAAPVDLTGVVCAGNPAVILSLVDDTEALKKVPVLRQLLKEGTLNGKVFKIDNSAGDTYAYALVSGNTGGIGGVGGEIITISAWARSEGGLNQAQVEVAGGLGSTPVNGEDYKFYSRTSDLVDTRNGQFAFLVQANTVGYFILNQCEIAAEPSIVPIVHEGASVTTTADVLTIGPAETGGNIVKNGTFDDMEDWVSGTQWVNEEGAIRLNSEEGISLENRSLVQRCLTVGKRYRMHYSVTVGALASGKTRLFISNQAGDEVGVTSFDGAPGNHFVDFTAVGSDLRLAYSRNSAGAGGYCKIDNLRVVELVPFEGWDSDADGHAILFDGLCLNTETADTGPYLLKCREVKYGNIGPWKTPDGREMRVVAFGNDNGTSINNTGNTKISLEHVDYTLLNVISFNQNSVAMSWNGETSETALSGTLHGLDQISFGVGRYIAPQPICIKRFAVYNRYLSEADLHAMVTK